MVFVGLALLVAVGVLDAPDRAVLQAVQTAHASMLDVAGSLVTILGQAEVLAAVVLGVAIARLRRGRSDWWIPLAILVVVVVELLCKVVVPQPSPPAELSRSVELLPALHVPTEYAFPSGHVARVAFLVTALRWPAALGAVLVVVMAITRIYLAEHWPSDVLGGWVLGTSVAWLAAARSSYSRGTP